MVGTPSKSGNAFEDRGTKAPRKNLKLSLDNKSSMTSTLPKPIDPAIGQKQAEATNVRLNDYAVQAGNLTVAYKKAILDKTLPANKSVIAKDAERGLVISLGELGTAINNDVREREGEGSMGNIALLLGVMLIQRDRINELGYVVETLERKVHSLEEAAKMQQQSTASLLINNPGTGSITLTNEQFAEMFAKSIDNKPTSG